MSLTLTPLFMVVLRFPVDGDRVTSWHLAVAVIPRKGEMIACSDKLPFRGTFRVVEIVHLWPQDDARHEPHVEVHVEEVKP